MTTDPREPPTVRGERLRRALRRVIRREWPRGYVAAVKTGSDAGWGVSYGRALLAAELLERFWGERVTVEEITR